MAQEESAPAPAGEAALTQSMPEHDPPRSLAGDAPAAEAGAAAPSTVVGTPGTASAADADGEWVGGAADDEVDDEGTLEEEEVPMSSAASTQCHA